VPGIWNSATTSPVWLGAEDIAPPLLLLLGAQIPTSSAK
jgi:hypothetical protein